MSTSTSKLQSELRKAGLIPKRESRKKRLAKMIRDYHDSQNFARGFIRDRFWEGVTESAAKEGHDHVEIECGQPLRRIHERMIQEAIEAEGLMAFFRGIGEDRVLIIDWKERPGYAD